MGLDADCRKHNTHKTKYPPVRPNKAGASCMNFMAYATVAYQRAAWGRRQKAERTAVVRLNTRRQSVGRFFVQCCCCCDRDKEPSQQKVRRQEGCLSITVKVYATPHPYRPTSSGFICTFPPHARLQNTRSPLRRSSCNSTSFRILLYIRDHGRDCCVARETFRNSIVVQLVQP